MMHTWVVCSCSLYILAEYTLLSMTGMVTPCLWYVVGMKLVMSYVKFPPAPFARAPFGRCRISEASEPPHFRKQIEVKRSFSEQLSEFWGILVATLGIALTHNTKPCQNPGTESMSDVGSFVPHQRDQLRLFQPLCEERCARRQLLRAPWGFETDKIARTH